MLEDLAVYIDTMRESLTRHLVVSGANDCETDEDFKKRWGEKDESTEYIKDDIKNEALTTEDLLMGN